VLSNPVSKDVGACEIASINEEPCGGISLDGLLGKSAAVLPGAESVPKLSFEAGKPVCCEPNIWKPVACEMSRGNALASDGIGACGTSCSLLKDVSSAGGSVWDCSGVANDSTGVGATEMVASDTDKIGSAAPRELADEFLHGLPGCVFVPSTVEPGTCN
jgi:hypothetical protein